MEYVFIEAVVNTYDTITMSLIVAEIPNDYFTQQCYLCRNNKLYQSLDGIYHAPKFVKRDKDGLVCCLKCYHINRHMIEDGWTLPWKRLAVIE